MKHRTVFLVVVLCNVLTGDFVKAAPLETPIFSDNLYKAWKHRRILAMPKPMPFSWVALPLPPTLLQDSQPNFQDLRLLVFSKDPHEKPHERKYFIDSSVAAPCRANLIHQETTMWTFEFSSVCTLDALQLEIPSPEFDVLLKAEAATSSTEPFQILLPEGHLFSAALESLPLVKKVLVLTAPVATKVIRLTWLNPTETILFEPKAVESFLQAKTLGKRWVKEVFLEPLPASDAKPEARTTRYKFTIPTGLQFDELSLGAQDPLFARNVTLVEEQAGQRTVLAQDTLYRWRTPMQGTSNQPPEQHLVLKNTKPPQQTTLILEINNGQASALRNVYIRIGGQNPRLIFPIQPSDHSWLLYYGNSQARPIQQDTSPEPFIQTQPLLPIATLGDKVNNPLYHEASPLQLQASEQNAVESKSYKMVRSLSIPNQADIYALTLTLQDASITRADWADLRIANNQNQAIPYILEPAETRIPLEIQPLVVPSVQKTSTHVQLLLKSDLSWLPSTALEFEFLNPEEADHKIRIQPLSAQATSAQVIEARLDRALRGTPVQRISLPKTRDKYKGFDLKIESLNGVKPLQLVKAYAVVSTPRMVFYIQPQPTETYRLLLGNSKAHLPHFDQAMLQEAMRTYIPTPIESGPLHPNPDFQQSWWSWLDEFSITWVLVGVVLLAIIIVSWVIAHLRRRSAQKPMSL